MATHELIVRGVSSVTLEKVTYKPGIWPVDAKTARAARRIRYGVKARRLAEPTDDEPVVKSVRQGAKAVAPAETTEGSDEDEGKSNGGQDSI